MVRRARREELDRLLRVYRAARNFMACNGNRNQWGDSYPAPALLEKDIAAGNLYVITGEDGFPHGAFAFRTGADPSYAVIEGAWQNSAPYGAIHRLASDGTRPRQFEICLSFCRNICPNIRADTHRDNRVMRHLLEKHGFVRCGIIRLENHSGDNLRIAYQLSPALLEGEGTRL